jgi:hypothetical protein
MRVLGCCAGILLSITPFAAAQSPQAAPASAKKAPATATSSQLEAMFGDKVKTEWEAFNKKDKNAYADLLAEDFVAVEDDNQGMRDKRAAANEIDRSVINGYNVFALKVLPLNDQAALVTYELTMLFPPKSAVRLKRVMVAELWLKREGQWKLRYYQETHVR